VLLGLGDVYVSFAAERTSQFRLMFGESGLPSRDPRLRLPTVQVGPYDQILALAAAHLDVKVDDEAASNLANLLWAGVHGIARLRIDGALPLTDDEARDMVVAMTTALLGSASTPRNARTSARSRGTRRS